MDDREIFAFKQKGKIIVAERDLQSLSLKCSLNMPDISEVTLSQFQIIYKVLLF